MRKILLIIGIISIIACVLSISYAALNLFGYYHVLDGSAELYHQLHVRMLLFFAIGVVLAVIGAVCLIVRAKM